MGWPLRCLTIRPMRVTGGRPRAGQSSGRRRGKKQFVVFAAVQSLIESCRRVNRQKRRIDLGGDAGLLAEMSQIGGEAVAEIERGGGQSAPLKPKPLRDARLRIEVRGELRVELFRDARRLEADSPSEPIRSDGQVRRRLRLERR